MDSLHQQIEAAWASKNEDLTDKLLAMCPDGECPDCGRIICPHGDWLHYHHDGCPSCVEPEPLTQEQVDILNQERL